MGFYANPLIGKTILASRVIEECKKSTHGNVIFFYCKQDDHLRASFGAVLRGLLDQLIRLNPELIPYFYEGISQSTDLVLDSLEILTHLTEAALDSDQSTWIILGGLDECNRKERKRIITWITMVAERRGHCHALFISQDEVDIRKLLSHVPSLEINESLQHQEEIRAYTFRKLIKL